METAGWMTHCFGRFLIDLPPQARVSSSYDIWGNEIVALQQGFGALQSGVDHRERELKSRGHSNGGVLFIDKQTHANESVSILSYEDPESEEAMWLDAYLLAGKEKVFRRSALVDPARKRAAIEFTEQLAKNIRSKARYEIPVTPGFCIDGGYIAGSEYMSESFRVGITLPQHPGMHITFRSSTGAEEEGLLERVGGFFRTEVLGRAVGMTTLRKGKRNVGPIAGEEYLVAGGDRQQRVYAFRWEFQGRDDSLAEPNLSLEMGVLERDPGDDDAPPPPAFESDEQALQLWDDILESIRLRPGAV